MSQLDPGGAGPTAPEPSRVTPYELAFGEVGFEEQVFPRVVTEAGRLGIDPVRRELFSFVSASNDAIREIVPPDSPPEALEQHRAILFHAFNFWRFGKRVYLVDRAVGRYLVEAAPRLVGWEVTLPHPSIYLQLPANLFWASIAPDTPPEPVDGFFATVSEGEDSLGKPFRNLDALMVLGIRRNRAGFSVIPFETQAGPGIAAEWAEASGRPDGRDFENVLPGGELSGLYSILTTVEALKLLGRILWYIDVLEDAVELEESENRRAADATPAGSRLPIHRVRLRDGDEKPMTA